jgi:hypothetical protein
MLCGKSSTGTRASPARANCNAEEHGDSADLRGRSMIVELLSSYLINATWFFLTSWGLFLVVACVVEFRQELS